MRLWHRLYPMWRLHSEKVQPTVCVTASDNKPVLTVARMFGVEKPKK